MTDLVTLRSYRRGMPPLIATDRQYIEGELQKLEQTLSVLLSAFRALEARIIALETPPP